jgi:hypothetical protein
MAIVDLKTNLKSLRYGKDRPFGGSSNQPYITRDIEVSDSEVGRTGGPDFLLRGGTLIPRRVANDVSRMTQMLFDLKSPNGVLFTAKQNVLSRTAVATQASGKALNEGAYLPTSTLLQVVGNNLGIHLNKQGLDPTKRTGPDAGRKGLADLLGFRDPLGLPVYNEVVTNQQSSKNNRLVQLKKNKLGFQTTQGTELLSYEGGPGSTLGIGKTIIKKGQPTNLNLENLQNYGFLPYEDLEELANKSTEKGEGNTEIFDFRQEINGTKVYTLNYSNPFNRIESRVNLGDPGLKSRDRSDYRNTDNSLSPTNPEKGALDKINAYPIYKSSGVDISKTQSGVLNDFVKFRIGIIQNDNPTQKVFIHFRALIDSFSDSYRSEWNSDRFMGRGENFYRYGGFDRSVSLSWTVAAQSKAELIPQYQKLNYLASTLAPDFSSTGYMRGNLVTLTIGGYLYEQPGIITNMTLDVPQESPWEIGLDSSAVKEMPHYVKVTGVNFIPIHEFTPRTQQNKYNGTDGWVSSYGRERYIALTRGTVDESGNGGNNNYGLVEGGQTDAPNYIPK